MKKDLLIFFGQYRTFDLILERLLDLDKVDVVISTRYTTGQGYSLGGEAIESCVIIPE